jgi:hypothetical protein
MRGEKREPPEIPVSYLRAYLKTHVEKEAEIEAESERKSKEAEEHYCALNIQI